MRFQGCGEKFRYLARKTVTAASLAGKTIITMVKI
jgi:hypothetical protein